MACQAPEERRHGTRPLIRVKPRDLERAGVEHVSRVADVCDGLPVLEDGRTVSVSNVIWCTGYSQNFARIDLPVFDEHWPRYPGHYHFAISVLLAGEPGGVEEEIQLGRCRLWQRKAAADQELKSGREPRYGHRYAQPDRAKLINTAADAAQALHPLAGDAAGVLLTLGSIGTAALRAKEFYAVIGRPRRWSWS